MRLLLIRHGQTPANVRGLLATARPGPGLTKLGRRQAGSLAESMLADAVAGEQIAAIYVSPLTRTAQTAAPLAASLGLDPHVLDVDVTTQQDVLDAIWHERRVELALEGDRWPDLVRTGRAAAVLGIPAERTFQLLYPIPERERVTAPGLGQNPGY